MRGDSVPTLRTWQVRNTALSFGAMPRVVWLGIVRVRRLGGQKRRRRGVTFRPILWACKAEIDGVRIGCLMGLMRVALVDAPTTDVATVIDTAAMRGVTPPTQFSRWAAIQ